MFYSIFFDFFTTNSHKFNMLRNEIRYFVMFRKERTKLFICIIRKKVVLLQQISKS